MAHSKQFIYPLLHLSFKVHLPGGDTVLQVTVLLILEFLGIVAPELLNGPSNQFSPKWLLFVPLYPKLLIHTADSALAEASLKVVEEVGRVLIATVPFSVGATLPVGRAEAAVETNPVGNALDEPAGAGTKAVSLETVNELVGDDASDLLGAAGRRADSVNVAEGEVDFLVVGVEIGARGVGDAGHVAEDEGDGAGGREGGCGAVGRRVEEREDVLGRGGKALGGVDSVEEVLCARVGEVADLDAELGELEVRGWVLAVSEPGSGPGVGGGVVPTG